MISPIKPGASKVAIFQDDIFPVGQPVVVRIPHWKLSSENRAAVQIRYFDSAAPLLLPRCGDDWPGGLNPSNALPAFFDRGRGTRPVDLQMVWRLARGLLRSLLKYPQKSLSRLRVGFVQALSSAVLHANKHGASDVEKIREVVWRNPNVVR